MNSETSKFISCTKPNSNYLKLSSEKASVNTSKSYRSAKHTFTKIDKKETVTVDESSSQRVRHPNDDKDHSDVVKNDGGG